MKNIVLIVEDYDDSREYMALMMKSSGYDVYEAVNGREAVEIAKTCHPNIILMDISMPLVDGLTATEMIRKSDAAISNTPIIAITAFGDDFKDKAMKAGCNDFITKPVDFATLQPLLEKYIVH